MLFPSITCKVKSHLWDMNIISVFESKYEIRQHLPFRLSCIFMPSSMHVGIGLVMLDKLYPVAAGDAWPCAVPCSAVSSCAENMRLEVEMRSTRGCTETWCWWHLICFPMQLHGLCVEPRRAGLAPGSSCEIGTWTRVSLRLIKELKGHERKPGEDCWAMVEESKGHVRGKRVSRWCQRTLVRSTTTILPLLRAKCNKKIAVGNPGLIDAKKW